MRGTQIRVCTGGGGPGADDFTHIFVIKKCHINASAHLRVCVNVYVVYRSGSTRDVSC